MTLGYKKIDLPAQTLEELSLKNVTGDADLWLTLLRPYVGKAPSFITGDALDTNDKAVGVAIRFEVGTWSGPTLVLTPADMAAFADRLAERATRADETTKADDAATDEELAACLERTVILTLIDALREAAGAA